LEEEMHVDHKPDPIPVSKANASQIEAGKLKRKIMVNHEGVNAATKTVDYSDLSEETYLAALELMKERFEDVKFHWDRNRKLDMDGSIYRGPEYATILNHSIWLAIEAEAKRQVDEDCESSNP
jgi:hypothetical protein